MLIDLRITQFALRKTRNVDCVTKVCKSIAYQSSADSKYFCTFDLFVFFLGPPDSPKIRFFSHHPRSGIHLRPIWLALWVFFGQPHPEWGRLDKGRERSAHRLSSNYSKNSFSSGIKEEVKRNANNLSINNLTSGIFLFACRMDRGVWSLIDHHRGNQIC